MIFILLLEFANFEKIILFVQNLLGYLKKNEWFRQVSYFNS